jgi:hypothetical protein
MGYVAYTATKADLIKDIKAENDALKWSLVGNHLWGLFEHTEQDEQKGYGKMGEKFIVLFKIESFGKGDHGYKVMDESQHPFYYDCPLNFLKQAAVSSAEWRDEVYLHHARKAKVRNLAKSIKVGDIVALRGSTVKEVLITEITPLKGRCTKTGITYRIPKKYIA